jgi:hypothetical protein
MLLLGSGSPRVSDSEALYSVLRQLGSADCVAVIEAAIREVPDRELCRINVLEFAAKHSLDEERSIAAFLHASRLGLFEMAWNVLCPGCGGVLDASATLKTVNRERYDCELCAAGYKPTLDEMVEVTFTISPRVRRIAGHDPDSLPEADGCSSSSFNRPSSCSLKLRRASASWARVNREAKLGAKIER